jgi:hypothetical protein
MAKRAKKSGGKSGVRVRDMKSRKDPKGGSRNKLKLQSAGFKYKYQ